MIVVDESGRRSESMCTKNELKRIVSELVKVYQSVYGDQIVKIVLYGSYARGNYDSESDVDMVALVRGDREVLQEQLKQVWDVSSELEIEFGTILSPAVIPYEEYEQFVDILPYYKNIAEEGVVIVA
jgi:predicted nucleotidyltransferase